MTGSLNKVQLIGHLGREPEVRGNQDGTKRALLSVATSQRWTDKQSGEKKQRTEWHRVVIWGPREAEIAEMYLRKGSPVYLEGELRTRKWGDKSGQERWTTEVTLTAFNGCLILLGDRRGVAGDEEAYSPINPPPQDLAPPSDEIPF
jgi:single-strand DNA-binding protein